MLAQCRLYKEVKMFIQVEETQDDNRKGKYNHPLDGSIVTFMKYADKLYTNVLEYYSPFLHSKLIFENIKKVIPDSWTFESLWMPIIKDDLIENIFLQNEKDDPFIYIENLTGEYEEREYFHPIIKEKIKFIKYKSSLYLNVVEYFKPFPESVVIFSSIRENFLKEGEKLEHLYMNSKDLENKG